MSAVEQGSAFAMGDERRLMFEVDQDEANRGALQRALADDSFELLASFEPDASQLADLDLQSAKIEALLAERVHLLGELQQYHESSDEELERAMENPAAYLQKVLSLLYTCCQSRSVTGPTMAGINEDWFSTYFSTIRRFREPHGAISVKPELFVALSCSIGRPYQTSTARYRRLSVSTNFRRNQYDHGSTYQFSTVPETQELEVFETYYKRGAYHRDLITDRLEQYRLFQALVVDMISESERLSPDDDSDAKKITALYVRNEIEFL